MDELLQQWARGRRGNIFGGGTGGNIIAMLMDTKGELIRGSGGSRMLLDRTADVELIYNKHLPELWRRVVHEHYLNTDSLEAQKLAYCACSQKTYYRRLHEAHEFMQGMLLERAA